MNQDRVLTAHHNWLAADTAMDEVREEAYKIFVELCQLRHKKVKIPPYVDVKIEIQGSVFYLNWEEYICGEVDYMEFVFPIEYLWKENWRELEEEKNKKLEELMRKDAEARAEKLLQDQRIKDEQEFERLRKKLGK